MPSRVQVSVLLAVSFLLAGTTLAISGVEVRLSWLLHLGGVVTGVVLALQLFDRWLWRWPWLAGWLVQRPDMSGTWLVRLTPRLTSGVVDPVIGMLVVRQRYSEMTFRLYSKSARSVSERAWLRLEEDHVATLFGIYIAETVLPQDEQGSSHFGAFRLQLGTDRRHLAGQYWTNRGSKGALVAEVHAKKCINSFEEGLTLFPHFE